jgi:hypothetical protein
MALDTRANAASEVAVISSDPSYTAEKIRYFREQNIFPQLLVPTGKTKPTLRNFKNRFKNPGNVYIGPDVLERHPDALRRIHEECRTLGLDIIQDQR